jgi:hypothetical protein
VQLDTGLGKTYLALGLVAALRLPAMFIVPTILLQKEGAQLARTLFPHLKVIEYSTLLAKKAEKKGLPPPSAANADIIFCVVNTASKKPPEFFMGVGILILDEAPEFHAPTFEGMLWALAPYVVGLSATPLVRDDKLDRIVPKFLGKPLSLLDVLRSQHGDGAEAMIKLLQFKFKGNVREVWYEGLPEAVADYGETLPILRIGRVIADPHRTEMVAAEVERILHLHETLPADQLDYWGLGLDEHGVVRRHSVFVFAEHRDYLPVLKAALLKRVSVGELYLMDPDEDPDASSAVVLRGGATDKERLGARHTRVILTTYGFSRRGVSFEHMTALVEASPRRNGFMQILGRICRLTRDPSLRSIRRVVVDVRDIKTSLNGQSSGRRLVYRQKEWGVSYVRNTYEDFGLGDKAPARPQTDEKLVAIRKGAKGGDDDDSSKQSSAHSLQDLLKPKLLPRAAGQ